MRTIRGWIAAVIALALGLTLTASARAERGDLTYQDCITGELSSGPVPDGTGLCLPTPGIGAGGNGSGLDGARAVVLSPDGKWLYAGTGNDASVASFKRDTKKGKLAFKSCISGNSDAACKPTSGATPGGSNSGLADVRSVAISPDGKSVYAASTDDSAIVHFKRDPEKGKLTYKGCFTGETESGTVAGGPCTQASAATSGGVSSGLASLRDIEVSLNGKSVYAIAQGDDALAAFTRNRKTGALTYMGCISGDLNAGPAPAGTGACVAAPSAAADGEQSGFDDLFALTLSPDGEFLYAVAAQDDAIATFTRNPATGALTYEGCTTGEEQSGPSPGSDACSAVDPFATDNGQGSQLDAAVALEVSPQGHALYIASASDAVSVFARDEDTGELTFTTCLSSGVASVCEGVGPGTFEYTGLHRLRDIAVAPDGRSVYTAAQDDDAVAIFTTSPTAAALGLRGCVTGALLAGPEPIGSGACEVGPDTESGTGINSGMDSLQALVVSPDGKSVYAASQNDSAITRLKRER